MIHLIDRIHSQVDRTVKFVYRLTDGLIAEVSYIDKNDGKDILCVPSHTSCNLGCKFCHTSDTIGKVTVRPLDSNEIFALVQTTYLDLGLTEDRTLLVSYMGCGEPLLNSSETLRSMLLIRDWRETKPCRFALATLIPQQNWTNFFSVAEFVKREEISLKVHLSLHFTNDVTRTEWMPAALPIAPSIAALEFYKRFTGQPVEIHYALIEGVNDHPIDSYRLVELLKGRSIPVKFLQYNRREAVEGQPSPDLVVEYFRWELRRCGVDNEYYIPPGQTVGASCGQFLMDYYLRYGSTSVPT